MHVTTEFTIASLEAAAGANLGCTAWTEIDQDRVNRFADTTNDHQWIHVDPERAKTGPFGATVAHGFLTLALIAPAVFELISVTDADTVINYGLEKVRFPAPVMVGSRIRVSGQIASVTAVPGGQQAALRLSVEIEGGAKPGCVADFLVRFLSSGPQ